MNSFRIRFGIMSDESLKGSLEGPQEVPTYLHHPVPLPVP